MEYLFLMYPKCTTCQKAKKWLDSKNLCYTAQNIKENVPSYEELKIWIKESQLPIKNFFNTNGNVYKELNLKEKLNSMTDDEKIKLLSTNGMLIKRPILIGNDRVVVGFKETQWEELLI